NFIIGFQRKSTCENKTAHNFIFFLHKTANHCGFITKKQEKFLLTAEKRFVCVCLCVCRENLKIYAAFQSLDTWDF
ncbi:hypothetical protein DOY81_014980, partial [Sarcophaga bullata]